jgi:hypothetical protein
VVLSDKGQRGSQGHLCHELNLFVNCFAEQAVSLHAEAEREVGGGSSFVGREVERAAQ